MQNTNPKPAITDNPATWPEEMREAMEILTQAFQSFYRRKAAGSGEQAPGRDK